MPEHQIGILSKKTFISVICAGQGWKVPCYTCVLHRAALSLFAGHDTLRLLTGLISIFGVAF